MLSPYFQASVPLAAAVLLLAGWTASLDAQDAGAGIQSRSNLEPTVQAFETDFRGVRRFYDLPWSETRLDRLDQFLRDWQRRLQEIPFAALREDAPIDYLLLRHCLQLEHHRLNLDRRWLQEMDELLPFRKSIQKLEKARWSLEPLDLPAAANVLASWPEQLKQLRQRLEKGRKAEASASAEASAKSDGPANGSTTNSAAPLSISPVLAKRTSEAAEQILGSLRTWYQYYAGYRPDFAWWMKTPFEEAARGVEDYAKFLREDIAGLKGKDEDPLVGEPIGLEALTAELNAEMIPYSPDELIAIGERELAWCENEMKKAAQDLGLGDDWKAALARVKSNFVAPGQQDEFVAQVAREAIQFVKSRDLVTLPPLCEETWRLTMISPETQKSLPFAAYGGQNMMVAYAKEEMKQEDKLMAMRGNNRHFTRIVVPHELIPGHHLQSFASARQRSYRSLFTTPFFVEGWALYWELTLWDRGYATTPEDRIGVLFWRMHRCARIIVSLKFHLGRMKPAEMVDFLVQRIGHEKSGATGEVRRYIGGGYSPLYQCGYMIGGLQLRALYRETVAAGRLSDRAFNDAVLAQGPIPIALVRAALLSQTPAPDGPPAWRFAD